MTFLPIRGLGRRICLRATPIPCYLAALNVGSSTRGTVGLVFSDHAINYGSGEIAGLQHTLRSTLVPFFGFRNSGLLAKRIAQVHAGSHEPRCELAFVAVHTAGS